MATLQNGKTTYAAGEVLPTVGSAEYNLAVNNPAQAVANTQTAAPVITPQSLAQEKPMTVSQPNPLTGAEGLAGQIEAQTAAFATDQEEKKRIADQNAQLKLEKDATASSKKTLLERLGLSKGQNELQDKLYSETVDPAEAELKDINNQILQEQQSLKKQLEKLDKNSEGLFNGAVEQEKDRVKRESISKQADLAVIQMAKQGQYDSAKTIADRKIAVQLEQDRRDLDLLKFDYEENKEQYTKDEQRQFEAAARDRERELDRKESDLKTISDLSLDALQNGAPSGIAAQMRSATSVEDAIKIGGQYVGGLTYRELPDGRAVMVDGQGKIKSILSGGKGADIVLTPEQQSDPFIQTLARTAGGKPISDTFAQKLDKGLTVLGQIGLLQNNVQQVKTGPIVGAFKGANPWDTNAQTIKAQLNAIVPNLARGVYGEVGVLTDNDIKTYSQTLPNLKSTEDVRNAVLGITIDLIGKSIKRTLEVNAANKKDVSGFIDIYTEMEKTKNSIFSQIPGYKNVSGDPLQLTPIDENNNPLGI